MRGLFVSLWMDYNLRMAWDMIGHAWAVNLLRQQIAMGQVRHAYLFTGADGIGKRTLALRFAQSLACEVGGQAGEICGTCRACRLIGELAYPDLHVVEAEEVGGTLQVDQVRELQRRLALSPFESQRRIALLLRFHEASISAANALLKTLEEPPAQVVLLLTARSAEALLPTVVSRCDRIHLRPVSTHELEGKLMERGEPAERAQLLAAMSGGMPGRALRLANDPEALDRHKQHADDLMDLMQLDRAGRFAYASQFALRSRRFKEIGEVRREAVEVLESWKSLLRGGLLVSLGVGNHARNPGRQAELERVSGEVSPEGLVVALQAIERTLQAIAYYANPQLAMETLMLDLPRLG